MALLYRGLAPSQLAPRVGSSASSPAPSEICTTCHPHGERARDSGAATGSERGVVVPPRGASEG
eukprot:scaffold1730_cov68-Phaeocystis_antarctica.AAC.11